MPETEACKIEWYIQLLELLYLLFMMKSKYIPDIQLLEIKTQHKTSKII